MTSSSDRSAITEAQSGTNHKTTAGGRHRETQKTPFWDLVQTLTAYLAIPVALMYPFGFFALFVQFTSYYFLDFYTAWYAASLVNRMVAIGQGLSILALALGVSVLLSAIFALILLKHDKGEEPGEHDKVEEPSGFVRRCLAKLIIVGAKAKAAFTLSGFDHKRALYAKLIGLIVLSLTLYVAFSRIVAGGRLSWFVLRGRKSVEISPEKVEWQQFQLWPDSLLPASIFLAGCSIGGWVIYRSYRDYGKSVDENEGQSPAVDYRLRPGFFVRGVTEGWMRSGLAIAYLLSVLASIVLAVYTPAYTPFVTYGDTVEEHGEKESTKNRFLSHTEGQWYFLHRIENDPTPHNRNWIPPDYTIVSLAEGQVDYVRIRPGRPHVSRVAPLPWGLGMPELPNNHGKSK